MLLSIILTILGLLQHEVSSVTLPHDSSDIGLSPAQIIENHDYICETHYITTEDGYVLQYHRIPKGLNDNSTAKKPAVLIMHGLSASSADFVNTGPQRGLGFVLADLGYDVWIGNIRGNTFSKNHTDLDPVADGEQFYNFTFHEMGYYDVANAIDYILELKGDDSLYYIGHSQGCTAFLVLASTRPEYNAKIRLASLMAPAAILKHYPSIFIQTVAKYVDQIEPLLNKYKIYEMPLVKEIRETVSTQCRDPASNPICELIYNMKAGPGDQLEEELLPVIYTNNPSDSGVRQLIHFAQLVINGGFSYFDYGPEKNIEVYGTDKPPAYNLSMISAPVAFYYAKNDGIVALEDVQTLMTMTPNVANDYLVPYELFQHSYFTFAKDIMELVYNELINIMAKY